MAVPSSPTTAVTGPLTAGLLNSYKSNVDWLMQNTGANRPYCHAYLNGAQTLTANTSTTATLDTEIKDTDGMHTGSNGFFTGNTAGLYLVSFAVFYAASSTGGETTTVQQNGTAVLGASLPFTSFGHRVGGCGFIQCAASDVLTLKAFSTNTTGSLGAGQTSTFMQAFWVSL